MTATEWLCSGNVTSIIKTLFWLLLEHMRFFQNSVSFSILGWNSLFPQSQLLIYLQIYPKYLCLHCILLSSLFCKNKIDARILTQRNRNKWTFSNNGDDNSDQYRRDWLNDLWWDYFKPTKMDSYMRTFLNHTGKDFVKKIPKQNFSSTFSFQYTYYSALRLISRHK